MALIRRMICWTIAIRAERLNTRHAVCDGSVNGRAVKRTISKSEHVRAVRNNGQPAHGMADDINSLEQTDCQSQ